MTPPLPFDRFVDYDPRHGLSADRLNGLYDAATAAVQNTDLPWFDPYDYGYDPVAVNSQDAINATIAAMPQGAEGPYGTILLPAGTIVCNGEIVGLDQSQGVKMIGRGSGLSWPYSTPGATELRFTQATSTAERAIDARSSQGFTLENMLVTVTNANFLGHIVDYSHSAGGGDTTKPTTRDVQFAGILGAVPGNARAALLLTNAILGHFENTYFRTLKAGARMREGGGGSVAYSNDHYFENCVWERLDCGLVNPGDGLVLVNPTVEGFQNGGRDFKNFIKGDIAGGGSYFWGNLSIYGGWIGDAFSMDYWFDPGEAGVRAMLISGLPMYQGKVLKISSTANAARNIKFDTCTMGDNATGAYASDHLVDLGNSATVGPGSYTFDNCDFSGHSGAGLAIKNASGHVLSIPPTNTWASGAKDQSYSPVNHTDHYAPSGAPLTYTPQAGAGTGGSLAVTGNDNTNTDEAGIVTLVTGNAGLGTGAQARVAMLKAARSLKNVARIPTVQLTPANDNASSVQDRIFVPQEDAAYWQIHARVALTANTTYRWHYRVAY